MLLQDEIVSKVVSGAGQVIILPSTLRYDTELIRRDFFVPVVKEYQNYRPVIVKADEVSIGMDGYTVPTDFIQVSELRPYYQTLLGATASDIIPKSLYELRNGIIYADPGYYNIQYHGRYTITNIFEDILIYEAVAETLVEKSLGGVVTPATLTIDYEGNTATTDALGEITGTNITSGSYDLTTNRISITFTTAISGNVTASFRTAATNPGVLELSLEDIHFVNLFAARFLSAMGTTKAIMRIDGLPIDITVDGLMEYGREKEAEVKEWLETHQVWWHWLMPLSFIPSLLEIVEKLL
ncbi:MAG: hypothetical protein ACTSRU_14295 [Candidatus Hodarchaeales archaeon]